MIPTFNKKFNAERSAKRIAARFEGVVAMGAHRNDAGEYVAVVAVAPDHPKLAEIETLAAWRAIKNDAKVFGATLGPDGEQLQIGRVTQTAPGLNIPALPEFETVPMFKPPAVGKSELPAYAVAPVPDELASPEVDAAVSKAIDGAQRAERKPRQARMFTKKTAVLNLLAQGCTNEQIREATGWQWHTVKGFISTMRSKGRDITTTMRDGIAFYKLEG